MERVLHEAFGKLYEQLLITNDSSDREHVNFTAIQGHRYRTSTDLSGRPFRLMLVGRAVNGWDEYRDPESFVNASLKNLNNAPETIVRGENYKDRFEWIDTQGDSARNALRNGIDPTDFVSNYTLTGSPFWSYSKEVWCKVYGQTQPWSERWFDNIVWSNLYKIAPHDNGNPDPTVMRAQKGICVELLKEEIEYFDPTHILFVTGKDWFFPFANIFENVRLRDANCSRGKNKNNIFAEGTATYLTKKGTPCKVVIACRPEMRTKEDYVNQISAFLTGVENITK